MYWLHRIAIFEHTSSVFCSYLFGSYLLISYYAFLHLAGVAVVYDSVEVSPFYSNTQGDMYLDEKDLIELQSPHSDRAGAIKEPYQKRYYFNPMNLPYNLE